MAGRAVCIVKQHAAPGWKYEPVERLVIVGVVRDGWVPCHVWRVVHAPQQERVIIIEALIGVVIRVCVWEFHCEAPPSLRAFRPGRDLSRFHAWLCENEGGR